MIAEQYRPVVKALYLVGALALYGAISEPVLQVWPLRPGDVGWRFGAVGLFSGAMTGVVFALAWLMGVALVLSHRRTARSFAAVNLVLCGLLLLLAASFMLDFLQVRGSVEEAARGGFDATVARALSFLGISVLATLALGSAGWRAARALPRRAESGDEAARLIRR
jgi:hypothetical protein